MHSAPKPLNRQAPARRPRRRSAHSIRAQRAHRRITLRTKLVAGSAAAAVLLLGWAALSRALAPNGNTSATRFDAIIVLGAAIDRDGNAGPVLLSRLTEAVREYERGVAPRIIVTGGMQKGHIQARVMARLAEAQGVPPAAVLVEPNAENTIENACFSARIMKEHGWKSAEVVTSASHLPRAGMIFDKMPIEWRAHEAPSLSAEDEGPSWTATGVEVLHTAYYLYLSHWKDRCTP